MFGPLKLFEIQPPAKNKNKNNRSCTGEPRFLTMGLSRPAYRYDIWLTDGMVCIRVCVEDLAC